MLSAIGSEPPYNKIVNVHDIYQLKGIERGYFVYIPNHGNPVPEAIMKEVTGSGRFVMISLDDQYIRARISA